jgi:hypothetical protein
VLGKSTSQEKASPSQNPGRALPAHGVDVDAEAGQTRIDGIVGDPAGISAGVDVTDDYLEMVQG